MKVNVKRIPSDGEQLQGDEPPAIMELESEDIHFTRPISYDFHAQIQNNAILVVGKLRTPVTLRCSRCVKIFDLPLEVEQFVFHQELTGEDFVDLTQNIREDIILELPQRALCRPDCRGLCVECGQDLNEKACHCKSARGDLRWHALDQIKLKR
ncbi:MAG: hypothetical protein PCFJNLEI_00141 [Verrucomicrobiae bacterium]|nr:hypothetical protein [Verrucomicrobiae bacterium]